MENRTKRDLSILNIVSDFEAKFTTGEVGYLSEKKFIRVIEYYEEEKLFAKALEVCNLALGQYSFRAEFYILKAKVLLQINKPKKALKIIKNAEKISPFELEIQLLKIKALSILNEYVKVETLINDLKSGATKTDLPEILCAEASYYEIRKEYDLMYLALAKALLINVDDDFLYERVMLSVELSKNYIQCIDLHLKIIDIRPYSYMAWYNLGHAYSFEGEYEKAIDAFEYSFIINKDFENGYLDCADLCMQIKNFGKALSILSEAIEYVESECETLLLMAYCQIQLANFSDAKYNLFKAIKLDPYNDEVYFNLGVCYSKENHWQNAIDAFHKAITLEDSTEDYYLHLGLSYYELGSFDKAGQYLRKAASKAPENSAYWCEYTKFLIKQGEIELALDVLNEAEDYTFGADLLYCRSIILLRQEKKGEAFELLSEALVEGFYFHTILFDIDPELMLDTEICAIIKYYKIEQESHY